MLSLSGADPLNLVGILTPGARLPSLSGNRVLYRDGVPIALLAGGEVGFLTELPPAAQWEAQNLLLRRARTRRARRPCLRRARVRGTAQVLPCVSCHFCTAAIVLATCLSGFMAV